MKTTLEIPDALFRQVKARATMRGQSMKILIVDVLQASISKPETKEGMPPKPAWRNVYGSLKHEADAVAKVQATIDSEFGKVDPDDWK